MIVCAAAVMQTPCALELLNVESTGVYTGVQQSWST